MITLSKLSCWCAQLDNTIYWDMQVDVLAIVVICHSLKLQVELLVYQDHV